MTPEGPLTTDGEYQRQLHLGRHAARRRIIGDLSAALDLWDVAQVDDKVTARLRRICGKLVDCGRYPYIRQATETGTLSLSRGLCRSRLCPTCGLYRARRMQEKCREAIARMDSARLLTLTLRSSRDALQTQIKHLLACWAKLRRSKAGRQHIRGGVYVMEITYNPTLDQWHPHLHVLVDGSFWAQPDIARLWEQITTDSAVVDIRLVYSATSAAKYLAKYCTKSQTPRGTPPARSAEWALALHGTRMLQTFGSLHGQKLDPGLTEDRERTEPVVSLEALLRHARQEDPIAVYLLKELRSLIGPRQQLGEVDDLEGHQALHQWWADCARWWDHCRICRAEGDTPWFHPPLGLLEAAGIGPAGQPRGNVGPTSHLWPPD